MKKYILNKILLKYLNIDNVPNIYIYGLQCDSRLIKKGDLFIAVKGYNFNGRDFINDALLKGAVSILTYSNLNKNYYIYNIKYNIFIFYIVDLNLLLSNIASKFYNYPSKKMLLIGVTGTNGKTTVVNLISYWVNLLGYKSAILSTIGNGFYGNLIPSLNTTDSAINIQFLLNFFLKKKSKLVSLEVSSHALVQNRVNSLNFSCAVFTNLTLDHLDYHKNFRRYELAKWKLFSEFNIKNLILNIDDPTGFKWFKILPKEYTIPISFNNKNIIYFNKRWLLIKKVISYGFIKNIYFSSSWGNNILKVFILGDFNIINIILSFVSLLSLNFNMLDLIYYSKYLILPNGRMELFNSSNKPLFIIDYAHTPDAFKKILLESRKYCLGKLWCIFGCTGNRDKNKRSLMGYLAKKYSDFVIITNDDLYSENEDIIVNDIKSGINNFKNVYIILNRIFAIKFCFNSANYNDVILILGKGHENFHVLKNGKIKYSDRYIAKKLLGNLKWNI